MQKQTLALESELLAFLQDNQLSKVESREVRAQLLDLPNEDIQYLRNRLFDLARDRLVTADTMEILSWLDRCSKLLTAELSDRQSENNAWFTPGYECRNQIVRQLNKARRKIEVCVFTISDNTLSQALIEAHQRDIDVHIISDNDKQHDQGSDLQQLIKQGIAVRFDDTPDHMHHKFCLIDGITLINGSFNWTRSATDRNQENIVVSNDRKLIRQFEKRFAELWMAFG
jgi:cardiolipin hydrolase